MNHDDDDFQRLIKEVTHEACEKAYIIGYKQAMGDVAKIFQIPVELLLLVMMGPIRGAEIEAAELIEKARHG